MRGVFGNNKCNFLHLKFIWTSSLSDITFVRDQGICLWTRLVNLLLPWVYMKHFQEGMPVGKQGGVHDLLLLPKKPETTLEQK